MASPLENAWKTTQNAEQALLTPLAAKDNGPTFAEIDDFITQYRSACESVIFLDFEFATSKNTEGRLWDAHGKINNRYRKLLGRFRDEHGKRKPVEKRKLEKHYVDFIKSSQRFYRGYIQRLASHFGGIAEVERVAQRFNPDNLSADSKVDVPDHMRNLILISCHQTLVRLGDLSRYRETEVVTKDRNWGPAIGYYDLAGAIKPSSGASHNQLAVIALADVNHLRATYHLYRALAVDEPHPTAKGNLELEFKKVLSAWSKGELIPPQDAGKAGKALTAWFVCLHARCYKGVDFTEHDELENEVLSQLAVDLKERSLEGTLQKFSLINIAAEYFARVRLRDDTENLTHFQSFTFFQRLNVKTFFTLLQVLLPELERFALADSSTEDGDRQTTNSDKVTAVARRILPGLRQYSSWLLSTADLLRSQADPSVNVQIKEFWKIYANALTLLAATFPVAELATVDYLLEEDEDTLGFNPLVNEHTKRRFSGEGETTKPRWHDEGIERHHPNAEMLFRIRELLVDALVLIDRKDIPISLIDGVRFVYQEDGLPAEHFSSPNGHHHALSSMSIEREDIQKAKENGCHARDAASTAGDGLSQSASASVSANPAMNRMVDALVESEASESAPPVHSFLIQDGASPPTPPGHTFDDDDDLGAEPGNETSYGLISTLTARDLVDRMMQQTPHTAAPTVHHSTPTPRPALPSIWNTPFTPLPGETSTSQSRPGTAQRISASHLGQHSQQLSDSTNGRVLPQQAALPTSSDTVAFQHELLQRQQQLKSPHTQPGMPTESSSWSLYEQGTPYGAAASFGPMQIHHQSMCTNMSPSPSSPFKSSFDGPAGDIVGRGRAAQFGAVGQTPPSGQGG